jgi:hypothetical protein
MATANESQGLKIAVAAFLSLSVILSIALYFLYSAYSATEARLDTALTQNKQLHEAQTRLQTHYNELQKKMRELSDPRGK